MELKIGRMEHGKNNLITDVPGVKVGHCTVDNEQHKTGVTVILPCPDDIFQNKMVATCHVLNGFGKTAGLMQIQELGTLESPIALTNTLNVGLVQDALVEYLCQQAEEKGYAIRSVNPVVCECNDASLNDIRHRAVGQHEVFEAIACASERFAQGDVGAGKGMTCHDLKGGIGSSSRQIRLGDETFTIGVLVQSNYGASADFRKATLPPSLAECDQGSIIIIVATDLPLSCRQLRRVLRRCSVGMARLGSYIGHGSGEIAVGFSTAPRTSSGDHFQSIRILREDDMNLPFRAVGEATEEAILQSMLASDDDTALDGTPIPSLRSYLRKP